MAGKGDKQRPLTISKETYDANWELAFKKKEEPTSRSPLPQESPQ